LELETTNLHILGSGAASCYHSIWKTDLYRSNYGF